MPITVIITKQLEPFWATDEDFAEMDDTQIIELAQEDISSLLDNASWEIRRS